MLPGNAGQSIDFSFYDVGDAAGNGTLSVLPPTDSNVEYVSTKSRIERKARSKRIMIAWSPRRRFARSGCF